MRQFAMVLSFIFSCFLLSGCEEKQVLELRIENADNVEININEDYIPDDILIYAVYEDYTIVDVTDVCTFLEIDVTKPGKKRVIVVYKGIETHYYVYIKE